MSKFSQAEIATHNNPQSLWITIDGNVYDLTKFQNEHPGGQKILKRVAGKDASKQFWKYHNEAILKKYGSKLKIGSVDSGSNTNQNTSLAQVSKKPLQTNNSSPKTTSVTISNSIANSNSNSIANSISNGHVFPVFGDNIPYGDPSWYQGYWTPYYNSSHVALRAEVREWVENEIEPHVIDWDEAKDVPRSLFESMGKRGYLAGVVGLHKYPIEYTGDIKVKSVPPENWDFFHEFVVIDELSRIASVGVIWNLVGGYSIGLPPIYKFATPQVKKRVLPPLLTGEKRVCLCITEPDAGSDVANITTTAKKTQDGKFYIVNGEKKWITNGIYADYFSVAVRTGPEGSGMSGISMLLLEKDMPGLSTRKMNCMGAWSSGTTYITFEDVKVPVENLIGKENQGFKVIMSNFNHERIGIIVQANRCARVCYEESMKYAHKRKTFGKKLVEHDVIRNKLANMAIRVEATHNWLENLIYQTSKMPDQEAMFRLGGAIAGCKAQATQTLEFCTREACQIFGGLSYTRGGQGAKIERMHREAKAYSIPGGSEEIMLDLAIRQGIRVHKTLGAKL